MKVGFVHLPYLPQQVENKIGKPSLSLKYDVLAIETIIQTLRENICF